MHKSKHKAIKWIIFATFVFFIFWGALAIILWDVSFIFDRFFAAALILAMFLLYDKMQFKVSTVLVCLWALLLHHLKLYGNVYFTIPFDRIMHFTAGVALALVFYDYFVNSKLKNANWFAVALIAIMTAAGVGSMMEIMEFIGYSFFGNGEGILFYGTGDFGEWNNSSWDLISNTLGSIFGVFVYPLLMKVENIINNRK